MLRLLCLGIAQCLYAAPALAQSLPGSMTANTNVSAPVTNGTTMTVNVTGPRAYAEWNSFNVAAGNTFQITNSGGPNNYIFVNRVTGGTASDISGLVQGNGHFWLLNPNGISVGSTGVFDVGGLLLSTATTLNGETEATNGAAFLAGATNTFSFGGATNSIVVQPGAQLTADIGAIALLANQVTFGGTANAGTGETAIIGAQAATVTFDADLNAFSTLTINTGSNQGTGVRVGGNSQFTAARTFISAAGMADSQGNILLVDDNAADNISFVGGDLVLYAGPIGSVTVFGSGSVQPGPGAQAGAAKLLIQGGINAPGRLDIVSSGGVGQGGTDLSIRAAGNLSIRSDIKGRDVALGGNAISTWNIDAQDDVVIRGINGLSARAIRSGQTVDALGPVDVVGSADVLGGATYAGNDVDLSAGTGLVSFTARPSVAGDYWITAGDFMGSESLTPDFGLGTTNAFSITDTAGGFTMGFSITNPGNFSFTTTGGGNLTTMAGANITSTNGNVTLATTGGGSLSLGGNVTTGAGRSVTLNSSRSLSQSGGVITTDALVASALNGIVLSNAANQFASGTFTNLGGGGITAVSSVSDLLIANATTASGDVRLTGSNILRLSNSTVSTGSGLVQLNGNVLVAGSNVINAGGSSASFTGSVDATSSGQGDLTVTSGTGTTFQGAVGGTSMLNTLTVNGMSVFNGGGVRTDSGISLGSVVVNASAPSTFALDAGAGALTTGFISADNAGLAATGASVNIAGIGAPNANVTLTATNGNLTLGNGDIGGSANLATTGGGGSVTVTGSLQSAGTITVNSANHARIASATSNGGNVSVTAAGEVTGANGSDRANLSAANGVTVNAGTLAQLGSANAGGNIGVVAGSVDITSATAGNLLSLTANAGNLTLGSGSGFSSVLNATGTLSVTGPLTTVVLTGGAGGSASLIGDNHINGLSTFSSNGLALRNAGSLIVQGVVDGGSGDVTLDVVGDNLQITPAGQVRGQDVVLSTTHAFFNQSGADAIQTGAGGHWVVYSQRPTAGSFDNLDSGNTAIWNGTLATVAPGSVSGNRYVFAFQPTLTFTTTSTSKVYGTDLTSTGGNLFTVSGLQGGVAGAFLGDTAATAYSGAPLLTSAGFAERASVAGGPYAIGIANGSVAGLNGYAIALNGGGQITVTPKAITGTGTPDNKTYDGNTDATGNIVLSGVVTGDSVGATGSFAFVDPNAGTGKPVDLTGATLTGADAGNYTLTISGTALADILRKAITGTGTFDNKTYDGTTDATGVITLTGVITGDDVGATGNYDFVDSNAGAGKVVTISGATLTGADAGNYTLVISGTALADILRKSITGTGTFDNKTYDGTTDATGVITLTGLITGDDVGATGSYDFVDSNAGAGKVVTISGATLTGADAGNYTLVISGTALADILRKSITGTANVDDKTYDGTTDATGIITLTGVITGDDVGATGSFDFVDGNAGTGKTVTIGGASLTGTDAGNYTLAISGTALADILRKSITGTGTAATKTYDGSTTTTGTISLSGVITGDDVGATGSFNFTDRNAGTGKVVTISGATLSGTDAGNYTLAISGTALADILRKSITGTGTAATKTYDGSTTTTGTISLSGVITGDDVGATGSFNFADRNAGTGKVVTISGATLSGTDAGNYTLAISGTALADILRKSITGTGTATSKTYDGSTSTTGTIALNGVVAGDNVGATGSFNFADRNAGTGKTVTISGVSLTGADAGNYTLAISGTALADILRKSITGTGTATSKTYDGSTSTTGTIALNGVVSGDNVGANGSFNFADRNAGTGKTVTISGVSLTGADAGNYTVTVSGSAVADILRRAITVTADPASKPEGEADPAFGYQVTTGSLVAGDSLAGALTRAPGEAPGAYAIGQGTLNASSNYQLTFVGSTLTITEVPVNPVPVIAGRDDFGGLVGFLEGIGNRPVEPLQVADERAACAAGSNGREASACRQARTQ
ncbi:hypothetical protein ASD14_01810 [Lysobacter sp. Root494]|nr:hypothetical protein ASD14_01810 [Lysobacter sp. Root494]